MSKLTNFSELTGGLSKEWQLAYKFGRFFIEARIEGFALYRPDMDLPLLFNDYDALESYIDCLGLPVDGGKTWEELHNGS